MAPGKLFSTLYRHRDLVAQFTRREVELRHKGSRLGHFWALLSPMTMLGLYLFVFGFIFGGSFGVIPHETILDFTLTLFLGLIFFNVIADTLGVAPMLIVNQPNFVKKVVFPLEIIPFSTVASSLYHACLSLLLLLAIAPFSHGSLAWGALAIPLMLLPLALIAIGLGYGFAAIGVFVRDVNQLMPFLSTAIMYASAIVYPPSRLTGVWRVLRFNPLLVIVDETRKLALWHLPPNFHAIAYAYAVSAIVLALGYGIFSILRPYFAEVI
jgi:lipopolysaccharide transport system permease protein